MDLKTTLNAIDTVLLQQVDNNKDKFKLYKDRYNGNRRRARYVERKGPNH